MSMPRSLKNPHFILVIVLLDLDCAPGVFFFFVCFEDVAGCAYPSRDQCTRGKPIIRRTCKWRKFSARLFQGSPICFFTHFSSPPDAKISCTLSGEACAAYFLCSFLLRQTSSRNVELHGIMDLGRRSFPEDSSGSCKIGRSGVSTWDEIWFVDLNVLRC